MQMKLGAMAEDGDCDGVITIDDCDDADETSTIVAEDGDCDGVLTADDCDDTDASSHLDDNDGYGTPATAIVMMVTADSTIVASRCG